MTNLIILSEDEIIKLMTDKIVPLRDATGTNIAVIMSERKYELYKKNGDIE